MAGSSSTTSSTLPDLDGAAELLHRTTTGHELIEQLPAGLAPRNRADAYEIQARRAALTAQRVAGWKIAATSVAGQQHINVSGPLAGRELADRVRLTDGVFRLEGNSMCVAEPEFAFVLARTLSPRASGYGRDEVLDAVSELRMGIELPSTRYADAAAVGELQLIADNACAHDYLLGPQVAAQWREVDLAAVAVRIDVSGPFGARRSQGNGAAVLGHPLTALTWLVNELSAHGVPLEAGQFVTTGTCCTPPSLNAGDTVRADFDGLGTVGCTIALPTTTKGLPAT